MIDIQYQIFSKKKLVPPLRVAWNGSIKANTVEELENLIKGLIFSKEIKIKLIELNNDILCDLIWNNKTITCFCCHNKHITFEQMHISLINSSNFAQKAIQFIKSKKCLKHQITKDKN